MTYSLSLKFISLKTQKTEAYDSVDEVLEVIKQSDLEYSIGASETTIEGDFSQLLALLAKVEAVATGISPAGFMLLANFTSSPYKQDIAEKLSRVERFQCEKSNVK